ncbi:NUDIX domain-containing protein [Candidatus Kaiserbacteria bacterium]|nr:NUDIX domain-containing protein [Candidatus Kaiserbacteria bacterium]
MRENFPYVGASYLFLIEEGKILLQRRCQTGFKDGEYGVPAGHLDGGETAKQGCAREIQEEIGITLDPKDLEVVHVMHRKARKDERIDFFMTTRSYAGAVTNCEPHKCDDLSWFPLDELPDNTIDYVRQAIESYKDGIHYSEFGW